MPRGLQRSAEMAAVVAAVVAVVVVAAAPEFYVDKGHEALAL